MSGSSLAPRPPIHLGLRAALGAILGWGAAYAIGCDGPTCMASAGLAAVTVRIALIDLKLRIVRDRDVLALLLLGSAWIVWTSLDPAHDLAFALIQGLGYAVAFYIVRTIYTQLRGRDGLGLGDVKIASIAGPLLTPDRFALAVSLAATAGVVFLLSRNYLRLRKTSRYNYIPFGSTLIVTFYCMWLI